MNESVAIRVDNVSLIYRSRVGFFKGFAHKALDGLNFNVNQGEIFGILGKNGSGKSTLLQVLAGILKPDEGEVIVDKQATRSLLSLGLGFNRNLTGADNAMISCMLNGDTKKQALSRLQGIKRFAELGKFFEQPVKTYSAGMRARLGFATAVLTEVDILLIDEVMSVGDRNFSMKAQKIMLEKLKGEQTVIFVSHNENQINSLCDRAIWLDGGSVRYIGESQDVMQHYLENK